MFPAGFLFPLLAALAAAQEQPARFDAIELDGGGVVTVRHGAEPRVTVLAGDPGREIRTEGDRLVIGPCKASCPHGQRFEVEVSTPRIARLAVSNGGTIVLAGAFPAQSDVSLAVSNGGTIDVRTLEVSSVSAAVSQGGRILTRPRRALAASVSDGGIVAFWGDPAVTSSVRRGGCVCRGTAAELAPLAAQLEPPLPRLAPLSPLTRPPAPPRAPRH